MPRELIATAPESVAFREYATRDLQAGEIRVRSLFGAVKHGTEMALYKGYASSRGGYDEDNRIFRQEQPGMVAYPLGLGNICVGDVVELGPGVASVSLGDRVFRHGSLKEEHVWREEEVWILPEGVSWQAAVCLDPADFALGALRDGQVRIGDAVAVFGLGAIGLLVVQLAKLAGAYPVIAVDPLAIRREAALECGADLVLDPTADDAGLEIKRATARRGADVCIEYSGSHLALQAALRGVAYGATVVAGAWPGSYPAGLDLGAEAHFNRPRLVFSRACSEPNPDYPNWDETRLLEVVWRLLGDGSLNAVAIVRPVVAFDDLLEAYPRISTHPGDSVKLGVRF